MKTGPSVPAQRVAPWIAAVFVVVALGLAVATNPGPQWRVAAAQRADGNVVIDGDPVPAVDAESVGDLLIAGAVIEWRGHGDLELVSPDNAVLAIAPGTVLTLPAPPPRWFSRQSSGRLTEGTVRFVPGPRFRGARLTLETPARVFTAAGDRAFELAHDPATGITRVDASGPGITEFARVRRAQLAR